MDNRILNSTAVQKLETPKPSISLSAKSIIKALITIKNRPRVNMVTGKVKMTKTGFTSKLSMESTMATIIAPV
jgi:hypothetical protein